jgi:hypothetical protein
MKKKPKSLTPPCGKSRAALTEWLLSRSKWGRRHYDGNSWLFCFNVKLHNLNLDFDTLLKRLGEMGYGDGWTNDPGRCERARAEFDELDSDTLYEWGVEAARRTFTGGRDGTPDDDAYNMTWNGTDAPCRFSFEGRSGGWLVLTHFREMKLDADNVEFSEWKYSDLRDLAEMVQFIVNATRDNEPEKRVEEGAAYDFFINVCADVPTTATLEKEAREKEAWECRDTVTI